MKKSPLGITIFIALNFIAVNLSAQTVKGVAIPQAAKDVLIGIMKDAGVTEVTVTSANRTAKDQLRVMYDLLQTTTPAEAKKLYGPEGDAVIDVYVASKAAGKTKDQILVDMLVELDKQLPAALANNRLMHVGREATFIVFDLDIDRVVPAAKLVVFQTKLREAETAKVIHRFLDPDNGEKKALHIEITK